MNIFEPTEYESDTFDTSASEEDSDAESATDILNFCDKITEELRSRFRRNCGSDDYCDDIYDDKFKTPKSGSHSYYADILAVAQLNEKNESGPNFTKKSLNYQKNVQENMIISPSSWICSGQWNPATGTGPLEELFQVLEGHHPAFSRPQNMDPSVFSPMFYPQEWATNSSLSSPYEEELIGISSISTDYPSFIDSFQRWNNDPCAGLPSTNHSNFMSHDYHPSF